VPAYGQVVVHGRLEHGHRLIETIEKVAKKLERLGKHDAVTALVHTETIGRIVLEHGLDVSSELENLTDGPVLLRLQLADIGGFFRKTFSRYDRAIEHRQVQLVLHDLLRRQGREIAVRQRLIERLFERALRADPPSPADVVHPECNVYEIRCAQRLQHPVEDVVAMLDFPVFPTDKRQPTKPPYQQVVATCRLQDGGRDMGRKRNELADGRVGVDHAMRQRFLVLCWAPFSWRPGFLSTRSPGGIAIEIGREHPHARVVLEIPGFRPESPAQSQETKDHLVPAGHLPHRKDHDWQQEQAEHVDVDREQQARAGANRKGNVRNPQEHRRPGAAAEKQVLMHTSARRSARR
jgi:hypothetical protein